MYEVSLKISSQGRVVGPRCFIPPVPAVQSHRALREAVCLSNVATSSLIMSLHFCSNSLRLHYLSFQEKSQGKILPQEQFGKAQFNFSWQKSFFTKCFLEDLVDNSLCKSEKQRQLSRYGHLYCSHPCLRVSRLGPRCAQGSRS